MAHVLKFALRGLNEKVRAVLHTISAFRMPTTYDTLTALLVGKGKARYELSTNKLITEKGKVFAEEDELDATLTELEDRGLVGWDKRANRYDLHPIVRGVVWGDLGEAARRGVYTSLHAHFEAVPIIDDWEKVNTFEDLTPGIELYNTLIGLGRFDAACDFYYSRLGMPLTYRLSANRHDSELLEMLFPDGPEELPRLSTTGRQMFVLTALALAYQLSGRVERTIPLYLRSFRVEKADSPQLRIPALCNFSFSLLALGKLVASEAQAREALIVARRNNDLSGESDGLEFLALTFLYRGMHEASVRALHRASIIIGRLGLISERKVSTRAQQAFWANDLGAFTHFANAAWKAAQELGHDYSFSRAARLQGMAAMEEGDFTTADRRLNYALVRARSVNLLAEELFVLIALAELRRRQDDAKAARELLDDVWESAERGPYPLFRADALNVLAQIERDEDNTLAAVEAATKAYHLAWCDGPPFAYHWGLEKAKQHLKQLGAPEPEMPPFDESKFEPMPEVEIDPEDEFHVGDADESPT